MTSEVTQAALEPCPFCGGEAFTVEEHWRDGSIRGGEPICKGCGVKMPRHWSKRKAGAITAWNTRLTAKSGEEKRESFPTKDAYMRACRALRWRHAELRAHGIEPMQITDDHPESPPVSYDFGVVEAQLFARLVDAGTDNECWVICAEADPGAVAFRSI